jgi:hypothetical protein
MCLIGRAGYHFSGVPIKRLIPGHLPRLLPNLFRALTGVLKTPDCKQLLWRDKVQRLHDHRFK